MGCQRITILAIAALVSIALAGCGGTEKTGETSEEDALAVINGVPLHPSAIDARLERMDPQTRAEFDDPGTLSMMIDREVRTRVLAQAAMDEGLTESEDFKSSLDNARTLFLADLSHRNSKEMPRP